MKVIVSFSGGKDSLAALLWTREHITNNFTTVFCDTGWEHPLTYEYIHCIADKLHLDDVVRYVEGQNATGSLLDDDTATSCMSYYGLCE